MSVHGSAPILIVGAGGQIGTEVVRQLRDGGHAVRALVRDRARARHLPDGVEVYAGDLASPVSLDPAFAGVERVFLVLPTSVPTTPPLPELEGNAYSAALRAGTPHVVKLSGVPVMSEPEFAETPVGRWHHESERRLRSSGLEWTVLRPAFFSSNVTLSMGIVERGGLFVPAGAGRDAPIDPRDIAAVALRVLTGDGHAERTYELTGPELLTYGHMVETVGRIAGITLRYVDVPADQWRAEMLESGAPAPAVDSLSGYFTAVRNGAVRLTDTVAAVLGRPPIPFERWARDHFAPEGSRAARNRFATDER